MRFDMISIPVDLGVRKANPGLVRDAINKTKRTANGHALYMLKLYHKTTATWNHQPKFHFKVLDTSDGIEITIWTDDDIFRWVDQGTSVRYMKMTPGFQPKTTPGYLGSSRGFGGPMKLVYPEKLPGIEARGFTDMIYEMRKDKAYLGIYERFRKEINKVFPFTT